ncbi:MAG: DUF4071 domain-containing protein [Acidobacteria bacterium]|nr:DUF4071 domain-containing protein [Acidobacteriota bacterium]
MSQEASAATQKTCFVIMGFGKKTDFETGRTLDLDKSYKNIIKPAVEAANLKCVRADEIVHSGIIDVPMYEQLLNADVVVCDLSTSNKNAFYELGIRHALRPFTTLVISEDGVKTFPFDINHVLVRQYHHLGDVLDFDEVVRFQKVLTDAITQILAKEPRDKDSPVYTFLHSLTPPALAAALKEVEAAVGAASAAAVVEETSHKRTYSMLMEEVDEAQKAEDFGTAKDLLKLIRKRMKPKEPENPDAPQFHEDPYIIQRLALDTYKEKHDTVEAQIAALKEACELLWGLTPETSTDTETLGLWGGIHKRLWDKTKDVAYLDEAVRSYERGFYLRNDYYNGINLAFLLNVRAANSIEKATVQPADAGAAQPGAVPAEVIVERAKAVADYVQAQRIRKEVLTICEQHLGDNPAPDDAKASAEAKSDYLASRYWVLATRAEAYLGMGEVAQAEQAYKEAYDIAPEKWMIDTSTEPQRQRLSALLAVSPLEYIKADAA